MKPSSISLIAATLAAIAGNAIATPVPHASASEQVNSFEREVNGEPDNLFARFLSHDTMARALVNYAGHQSSASQKADSALHLQPNPSKNRAEWQGKVKQHEGFASRLKDRADQYRRPGAKPDPMSDIRMARNLHAQADKTIRDSGKAIDNRYKMK